MKEIEFKFLEDTPIVGGDLKFGHEQIASTLMKIVLKCHTPFTIGLYGKWGSGKSSITEKLREKLHPKSVPLIIFDVWKHEGDALRRTFLKELVSQLDNAPFGKEFFRENFRLNERLEGELIKKEVTTEPTFKFDGKRLYNTASKALKFFFKKFLTVILIISLFVLGIGLLVFLSDNNITPFIDFIAKSFQFLWLRFIELLKWFLGFGFVLAVVLILIQKFVEVSFIHEKKESKTSFLDRLQDPHQFEIEFNRILSNLENRRIVIAFDNLDRVSGEKAVTIISTIKTFLEPIDKADDQVDVVFLIPCDVEAVKEHLNKSLQGQKFENSYKASQYADEFLKKFFNTIVWITDFHQSELEQMAAQKLKETMLKDLYENEYLSWLITKTFRNNPRQIIQFINILISNYLILESREESGQLEKGFIKKNIASLGKFLLLLQRFPDIMNLLAKEKLNDINKLDPNVITDEYDFQKEEFLRFLDETDDIEISNLQVFFKFKKSDSELAIPGIDNFLDQLKDRQVDEAIKSYTELVNDDIFHSFNVVLKQALNNMKSKVTTVYFIESLFKVTNHYSIQLENTVFKEIQNKLTSSIEEVYKINPGLIESELLNKYIKLTRKSKEKIVQQYAKSFADTDEDSKPIRTFNEEEVMNIVQFIFSQYQYLSKPDLVMLKNTFTSRFSDNSWLLLKLVSDKKLGEIFLSTELVSKFISSITINDIVDE